jgi:hypothetical protein
MKTIRRQGVNALAFTSTRAQELPTSGELNRGLARWKGFVFQLPLAPLSLPALVCLAALLKLLGREMLRTRQRRLSRFPPSHPPAPRTIARV